jgi:hypothetical protein
MVLDAKDTDDDELSLSTAHNNIHSQKRCKKLLIQETRACLTRVRLTTTNIPESGLVYLHYGFF